MPLLPPLVWRPCSLFIFHCNIKIFKYLFSLKYRPLHFVLHNLSYVTLLNISVCCFLCTFHRNKIFLHHHSNSDILDTQKSKHQIRTPFFSLFLLCIFCDKLDLNQRTSYFHNQIRSKPDFLATRHITNTFNIHDHLWRLRPFSDSVWTAHTHADVKDKTHLMISSHYYYWDWGLSMLVERLTNNFSTPSQLLSKLFSFSLKAAEQEWQFLYFFRRKITGKKVIFFGYIFFARWKNNITIMVF